MFSDLMHAIYSNYLFKTFKIYFSHKGKQKIKRKSQENVKQHINEARLIAMKRIVIWAPRLVTCTLVNKMETLHI